MLASYNAGEAAVRRWVSERPNVALDEFIDDIPFPETQNYVKKILGTAEDYRRLYGPDTESRGGRVHPPAAPAPEIAPVAARAAVAASSSKSKAVSTKAPEESVRRSRSHSNERRIASALPRRARRRKHMSKLTGSKKATQFTESVIREMTRLNQLHGGVNLSQGFPDFPAPAVKEAACAAINADVNQYAVTWGARPLREAIAREFTRRYGLPIVADEQVTVCCGSTEAMMSTMMAIIDPGDEVVIFEPFYENYGPDAILSGATPRYVTLHEPDWTFDPDELAAAFNEKTKAIIINTPNNPTGKVFTREELETIAALCRKWDAIAISDEIYEHIIYDGHRHIPIATIEGMADRTVTINGLSKTYSVTGWRVGWTISPPSLTGAIRKVHDFLTVGAAAPLQEAGAVALALPDTYYLDLAAQYQRRRDMLLDILERHHFTCYKPHGAYYIMTDISTFGFGDDVEFARYLVRDVGVAAVPGSSFYKNPAAGRTKLRFCFCKRDETLLEADRRLGEARPRRRSNSLSLPTTLGPSSQRPVSVFDVADAEPRPQYLATTPIYAPLNVKLPVSVLMM